VARDSSNHVPKMPIPDINTVAPKTADDARSAFDRLFKK
jgi:hypothetical protein